MSYGNHSDRPFIISEPDQLKLLLDTPPATKSLLSNSLLRVLNEEKRVFSRTLLSSNEVNGDAVYSNPCLSHTEGSYDQIGKNSLSPSSLSCTCGYDAL